VGFCEHGDVPPGSGTMELVSDATLYYRPDIFVQHPKANHINDGLEEVTHPLKILTHNKCPTYSDRKMRKI
jgi:hypothetical protein